MFLLCPNGEHCCLCCDRQPAGAWHWAIGVLRWWLFPLDPGGGLMSGKLESLFGYLDGLKGRPALGELVSRLEALQIGPADLAGWVRFSERNYQRNLVRAGEWYHLWVMCWRNGRRSPIHD